MREVFRAQIDGANIIDEEILSKLKNQKYFNGDPIKISDKVLFALLEFESDESQIISLKVIMLNESHFDHFILVDKPKNGVIPILKIKDE